jgi:outer membrane lipoprotein-sorting protein
MNGVRAFTCAICIGAAGLTGPATQPAAIDPQLESKLVQIDAAAGGVKDLSARFEQDKFTALLKKPLISTGTVRCAGSVIRWDTEKPQPCTLYADQSRLILYYPGQKLEEIYAIDQRLGDLLSSPLPRLGTIEKHFSIEPATADDLAGGMAQAVATHPEAVILRLTPSDAELARHIQRVVVALDPSTGLTLVVQTTDSDGDRTQITFSDLRTNSGIDAASLALNVPSDTTVSHPLDSAPAQTSP